MTDKKVKVIIGARRGDEGKGLMTDYFCHQLSLSNPHDKILNVRFNGGAQAGHTVVRPRDKKRHVFQHFGSGMLNRNVSMYYKKEFIMNPICFNKEQDVLNDKFLIDYDLYAHKDCMVSTPYDMVINAAIERKRGDTRHGSCGLGINETILRWNDFLSECEKDNTLTVSDHIGPYLVKRLNELDLKPEDLDIDISDRDFTNDINFSYDIDTNKMMHQIKTVSDDMDVYERFDHIVFEGAQGLLLAKSNIDDAPHLTPSETGVANILDNLKELDKEGYDIEIIYVLRAYDTRHGAGPMEHECEDTDINKDGLVDETNKPNEFQGSFRYGYIDMEGFINTINKEKKLLDDIGILYTINFAVTHLDETNYHMYLNIDGENKVVPMSDFHFRPLYIKYLCYGPTRDDVNETYHSEVCTWNASFDYEIAKRMISDGYTR